MKINKYVSIFLLGISISLLTGCTKYEEYDYSGNNFYKKLSDRDSESITEDGALIVVDDNQFFIRLDEDLKYKVLDKGEHELEKEEDEEYSYYFVSMDKFTDINFGTTDPILFDDKEYGELELIYFGSYDYEISNSKKFVKYYVEALEDEEITLDEYVNYAVMEELGIQINKVDVENYGSLPVEADTIVKAASEELENKGIKVSNLEIGSFSLTDDSKVKVQNKDELKMVGSLYIKNNSWIANDGSEMKFGDGTMYWYQTEGAYSDNYYYGKYTFYIGEEAVNYITTELSSYGVTKEELEKIFENNEEYSVDNFVVFDLVYDGIVLNGVTTVPNYPQVPWYGFLLNDNTELTVVNMNTGSYYNFTRK